jgi:ABC-type multidrug transport system fused ATPase/permease subunit
MVSSLWRLFKPFERDYVRYMLGVLLRQALLVAGGYSMVLALRLCARRTGISEWIFVAAFLFYDAGLLRLDISLNTFFSSKLGYPLFGKLRTAALAKVFEMPLEWHHRQDSGVLAGKVNLGVGKVVQTAEGISRELLPALLRTAMSMVPLLLVTPATVPAAASALALFVWLSVLENRKRAPFRESRYENYGRDHGIFAECVRHVRPVIQFGQANRMMGRYRNVQDAIIRQGIEETLVGNIYSWRRNMLLSVTKRLCQGIWLWKFRAGVLDAAMVMYLSMLLEELLNSFWGYAALLERIYDGVEPTRILVHLLDETPAIRDSPDARPQPQPESVGIQMVNLSFSYSGRNRVMQDLNLAIEPGSIVGLVGRSGGGKTTIHGLLSRMFEIDSGRISICGEDIRHWPLEQLRGLFSYVTQDGGVFFSDMSLADTIRFARPEATMREVIRAAKAACIHEHILKLPLKYRTNAGERGVTFSKGQQQRIAIAQALLALDENKKVLVLDEFTSALDSQTERALIENLRPYLAGRTVLIIAHHLATIKDVADKIVVVQQGRVAEQGSHSELMKRNGWYAEMARIQAVA